MNKNRKFGWIILIILALTSLPAFADDTDNGDIDLSDASRENIEAPKSPFAISSQFDAIGKADIKDGFYKKDGVEFAEGEIEASMVFYFNEAYKEGLQASVNYTSTYLHWAGNPWFSQDRFKTFTVALNAFSKRLCRWTWRSQLAMNIDANEWDVDEYATYNFIIWGRYEYFRDFGVNVGLIAQTGMLMDRVTPILGIDWKISRNWALNLVFPLNMSLEYTLNKYWALATSIRIFNSRHRVNDDEPQPKSLVRYTNTGCEFAIRYEDNAVTGNIHIGSTLGGKVRIANKNNHHSHRYRLEPSGYVGAEVALKF